MVKLRHCFTDFQRICARFQLMRLLKPCLKQLLVGSWCGSCFYNIARLYYSIWWLFSGSRWSVPLLLCTCLAFRFNALSLFGLVPRDCGFVVEMPL